MMITAEGTDDELDDTMNIGKDYVDEEIDNIEIGDDEDPNMEIQEACREVLGLKKRQRTKLTVGEFYAPTPDFKEQDTNGCSWNDELAMDTIQGENIPTSFKGTSSDYSGPSAINRKSSVDTMNENIVADPTDQNISDNPTDDLKSTEELNNNSNLNTTEKPSSRNHGQKYNKLSETYIQFDSKNGKSSKEAYTNRACTTQEGTKQISISLAQKYVLPSEKSTLSNKHFDFVPAESLRGKYSNSLPTSSSSSSKTLEDQSNNSPQKDTTNGFFAPHRILSQAPTIALQRSKTIYKNQITPTVQFTGQKSPPALKCDNNKVTSNSMEKRSHRYNNSPRSIHGSYPPHMGKSFPFSRHNISIPSKRIPGFTTNLSIGSKKGGSTSSHSEDSSGY